MRQIGVIMKFYEFGERSKPAVMLIHGGGNSKWMFERQAKLMKDQYRVILPELDGHGNECNVIYESSIVEADKIVDYIRCECEGKLFLIGGASLGAQIAMEVCARPEIMVEHAILESGLYTKRPHLANLIASKWMIKWMMDLYQWEWMIKWSFHQYGWPEELLGDIANDAMKLSFVSNRNLYHTYLNYEMPKRIATINTKVFLLFGSKEKKMIKRDAFLASRLFKHARVIELNGYNHCGFSFSDPEMYVKKIQELI